MVSIGGGFRQFHVMFSCCCTAERKSNCIYSKYYSACVAPFFHVFMAKKVFDGMTERRLLRMLSREACFVLGIWLLMGRAANIWWATSAAYNFYYCL